MKAMTLRLPQAFRRFTRDRRGVSAVEFAILAPVMVGLYLGCAEVATGVSVDRKVTMTVAALANLTASCSNSNANSGSCSPNTTPAYNITTAEMNNILDASSAIISPYSAAPLKMTVSCLNIDANKNVTVKWSFTRGGTVESGSLAIPPTLAVANSQLIFAEASYAYTPAVGYTITGALNLSDKMYMSPRIAPPAYNGIACS
jgi:Flp pilus assembly protein TadG